MGQEEVSQSKVKNNIIILLIKTKFIFCFNYS